MAGTYIDTTKTAANDRGLRKWVRLATAAALPANTRTGNTLLADANGALGTIDGVTAAVGDRVLVKNESTGANKGIYVIDSVGGASAKWQMTRADDFNDANTVVPDSFVFVSDGSTLAESEWVLSADAPITVNTTALNWIRVDAAGGAPPTGAAGGDLGGTYPNPTVVAATGASGFLPIAATGNVIRWVEATTAPGITQATRTTDAACATLTITSQAPFASATGSNRNPGNLVLTVPAKASGGTAGSIVLSVDGAEVASFTDGTTSITTPTVSFPLGVAAPTIKQADLTTNSGTGAALTIQAQNETGTTSVGGALNLQSGTGTSTQGAVNIKCGATTRLTINEFSATLNSIALVLPGTNRAAAGDIRAANATTALAARNAANGADLNLVVTNSSDQAQFGISVNNCYQASGVDLRVIAGGGVAQIWTGSLSSLLIAAQTWTSTVASPILSQADDSTASATGDTLTIHAQNATGTTATGGQLDLASGTGTSTAGAIRLLVGATERFKANVTGIGFFAVTPVARASAITQTYATAARTNPNMTASTVATTGSTTTLPFGYTTSAQADAIPVAINALITDVTDLKKLVNALIDDLQAYGLEQ